VSIYPSLARWSEPQQFVPLPEADRVVLYSSFTADHLRWLAAQPKLTTLTVAMTDDQSLTDLNPLSASSSLRSLRILRAAGDSSSEPLAWPPNLEVLDLQGTRPLARERLTVLSRLPHLHTLAVRLHAEPPSPELPADVMATLNSFPALRRLYLVEAPDGSVRETQRTLTRVSVRAATWDSRRGFWVPVACLVVGLMVLFPAVALSPQFAGPSSMLLPGYRVPHAAVGGGLVAAGLAITIGLLRFGGVDWLAAGGLCGAVVALSLLFPVLLRRLDPGMTGFMHPGMFTFFGLLVFVWPTAVPLIGWGEVDWFLRGERPWLSAALIVTGALAAAYTARWLTTLYRRLEECGRGGSPLGLDLARWQAWAANLQDPILADRKGWLTAFDRRLDAAAFRAPGDAAGRRRRLAAGAQFTPLGASVVTAIMCGVCFAYIAITAYFRGDFASLDRQMVAMGFGCTLAAMVFVSTGVINARRQFHSMELLWPVSRTDWIRDWFVLSVRDLAIPILLAAAGLCVGWWFNVWPIESAASIVPLEVIFVGAVLTVRAAELWQRTYAPNMLAMVACVVCGVIAGVSASLWWVVGSGATAGPAAVEWLRSPTGLWTVALGTLVLAAGLMFGAHRRWLRWELAA
jgi:hypothetical protein